MRVGPHGGLRYVRYFVTVAGGTLTVAVFHPSGSLSCLCIREVSTETLVPSSATENRSIPRVARPEMNSPCGVYLDLCLGHWKRVSSGSHLRAVRWCGQERLKA